MVQGVATNAWGRRILISILGTLVGLVVLVTTIIVVLWNEGHGLRTTQSLLQTQNALVTIPDVNAPLDAKNDMHVIYLSGLATTEDTLNDQLFNITQKAIQLHRQVEMYQWQEEIKTKTDNQFGSTQKEIKTYNYNQVWSDQPIDSSKFNDQTGHQNPPGLPIKSQTIYAVNVSMGDFTLPKMLIAAIHGETNIDLSKADLTTLKNKLNKTAQMQGDTIYIADNPAAPKIGDVRISMAAVLPKVVSIIAQQTGTTLQPYLAPAGESVSLIEMGQVSPQQMIKNAEPKNNLMTWLLRVSTLAAMIIGFWLLMMPVVLLADVVPFFGKLSSFGAPFIAFMSGLSLWALAAAIAWLTVSPMSAFRLIGLTAIICYLIYIYKKRRAL